MLRWRHAGTRHPRPCPRAARGPLLLHSIHAGSVLGQEHSCLRLGQDRGARTSPWRTERELEPWARRWQRRGWRCQARAGGRRSAAVVDAEALGDVLAAQRASTQRLAALLAAADVAAVEEDHLGLRRECGSVWEPARPDSPGMGQVRPPAPRDLTARSSRSTAHLGHCLPLSVTAVHV